MLQDEIVEEIHRIREEYSRSFNHDLKAIFADLLLQQSQSGREVVRCYFLANRLSFDFELSFLVFSQLSISQSSIGKLFTRWNSLVLWVTRVKLFVSAMAAICKSYAPIGVPNVSS